MPLDGHSFLVAQGWSGKGNGLRQGAISRPITVSQKKTLSGIGKDRDEAFPFWDHLFSAAAKSITVRITSSDEEDSDSDTPSAPKLQRTTTGILSNKRPAEGTLATPGSSGSSTPDATTPKLSLLATAKRDAAKRGLYSNFFRGPVLGPDPAFEELTSTVEIVVEEKLLIKAQRLAAKEERRARKEEKRARKLRKLESTTEDKDKAERKRRRKEAKAAAKAQKSEGTEDEEEKAAKDEKKKRRRKPDDGSPEEPPRKKKR